MFATATAATFMTANKGETITIGLIDGTTATGTAISVNSKGINIKVDDKVRSFGLARVASLEVTDAAVDTSGDPLADVSEDLAAMLHDGMTTRELAGILGTTPKELRVHLRALGMGVGKGRKYSLTPSAYIAVRNHLAEANA